MTVLLKEESSDIDSALNDLISFESAITHIALNSDMIAMEAFDIGKVKDTVVKAFKAFWKRITELYTRFVKWLKGKFGYGDMKGDVADAKKDVNKKTSDEVRAAEQNQVFETSDGKPATVKGFIGGINDIVAKHLPKSATAVIESLEQYREGSSDDQKSLLNKIIDYYRKFFICYGSGDELLDTEAISDIAKLINDDINGARKAFFDFIKLPAGTSVEILTRKIETFRGLGLFGKIADVLKPYVDGKSEGDRLSVLSDMLPQVSKIQELDFSKIKKVKKDPALDESLIGFLAERSNETLDKLLVTISAYEEISGVIEEQADEFSKLKPDVIMPGSTLEEVRPYIDTATAFSKVQTALTKLMLHQYTAEMALVNATVALRDTLNNFVIKKNEIVISYNSVSIAGYVPPKLIQKYGKSTDPDPERRLVSAKQAWMMEYISDTKKPIDVIDALKAAKWLNHHNPGLIVPYNHQENGWTKPIETDPLKWRKEYISECQVYMGMNFSKERIENVLAARKYFYDKSQQG